MAMLNRLLVSRRSIVAGGIAGMVAGAATAGTENPTFSVPEVDALTVQIVDDAATFGPFLPDLKFPGMTVTRAGNGGLPNAPRMLPHALVGEFGLSIIADSIAMGQFRRVMIDFGYSKEALANNLTLLGIDPLSINEAVLSHGHLDHYGGYSALFGEHAVGDRRLPLTVGGEEAFCERVALIGDPPPVMGMPDRASLVKAGFDVRIRPDPAIVADQAFTTGIIPLESFERVAMPTQMRPGIGCDRAGLSTEKRSATQMPDDGEHEIATCYAVKGLGLVVIASCSHRGVINSVRRAQALSGVDTVHAVIGGFHLVRPRTDGDARRTVAEFALIDPTYLIPMHCTGEEFIGEAIRLMPQKVVRSYVGSKFQFGAAA